MGPLKGIDNSDKYNMTRSEQMSKHLEDFIGMHKPYIESGFIPRRDEVSFFSFLFFFFFFLRKEKRREGDEKKKIIF